MSSSSSWGTPESVKDEKDFLPSNNEVASDGTSRSGLEALRNYESPTNVRSIDLNFGTVEEEDTFLYGNYSLQQEGLLEMNETQSPSSFGCVKEQPKSLDWSDEEEDCVKEQQKSLDWSDEEGNCASALSDFRDVLKSDYVKTQSDWDDFEEKEIPEDDSAKEYGSLDQQQLTSLKLELYDGEKEIKYSHTESFLKIKQTTDETNKKSVLGIPNSSEETNVASESGNNMQKNNEQQNLLEDQCNNKLENRDLPAVHSGSQALPSVLPEPVIFNLLMAKRPLNNSGQLNPTIEESSQSVSERTILAKHSKTSSQTEKIVLKTCDKTSSTIVSNMLPRKAFPQKTLDNICNYIKGTPRSYSQSEYVQDSKQSSNTNSGGVFGPKPLRKSPSRLSSNFESFHQSSSSPKHAIKYEECGKSAHKNNFYKANRYKKPEYKRRPSCDRSPRRRSRDISQSYTRSPRHSSRGKYGPRRPRDRSSSHHRSPRRYSRSRSRSHRRRSRRHSRDKSRLYSRISRRYSRDECSQERKPKYESYERCRRSPYSGKYRNSRSPYSDKYRNSRSRSRDRVGRTTRSGSTHRSSSYKYSRSHSSEEREKSHKVRRRESPNSRRASRSRSTESFNSFCSLSLRSSSSST